MKAVRWMTLVAGIAGLAVQAPSAHAGTPAGQRNPVVLVHGFSEGPAMWNALEDALVRNGYSRDQITAVSYNSYTRSNVTTADAIGKTVADVLRRTGAAKVDIVSHSMGSLNSRYCVKFAGCAGKTDHWVSLAGANKGTGTARFCSIYVTCREMIPGSAVLKQLNADPALPAGTKWSTLWTRNDGVIVPATNTPLAGATNIEVDPGLRHGTIFKDAGVIQTVIRLLGS